MTGMEHAIEQAARVVDGILSADPQVAREMFGDEPDRIARALADAGYLAPAPMTSAQADAWDEGRKAGRIEADTRPYYLALGVNPYRQEADL